MPQVEFARTCKSFGAVKVVRDLDLTIEDGAFTVLLGASGCGKTTLLRMVAGLEDVTSGDILIGGRRINDVHPRDRDIAMVFQNYALYPTMTVFKNIAFALEVKKTPTEETRRKVHEAAEVLNLTDYLDRYPKELSGGQRQRVAMGRAMVRNANVFLFDEPLSNLDAKLRAHMRLEIRRLHDRLGTTTIYVTHDQIEAMTMADQVVLMKDGAILQAGSPDALYDAPASRYVADFIGTPAINFTDGVVEADDGVPAFVAGGFRLPLPASSGARPGERAICGLRPSDLTLAEGGPISGRVALCEKTGADQNVHLTIDGADFTVTVPRDVVLAPGEHAALAIAPEKIHLFDAVDGWRL